MFVAAGHDGLRLSSSDGLEWKHEQKGKEGEIYRAIAFGNGAFSAVGSYGGKNILAATKDGVTWQFSDKDAKYVRYYRGLCFGDGRFVALGGDPGGVGVAAAFVSTSTDGFAWGDYQPIPGKFMIRRAAFGGGLFVGVGDRGRRARSKDALNWEDVEKVKALDTLIDVAYGNGIFVGVGLHGLRMTTKDGLLWSDPLRGEEGEHLNSILFANDRFVAVGAGATYFSPDGATWERVANENAPVTSCFGDGVFVGSKWKGNVVRSTDAVKWIAVYKAPSHVESVAFGKLD